jgi:hypothetical protein
MIRVDVNHPSRGIPMMEGFPDWMAGRVFEDIGHAADLATEWRHA